MFRLSLRNLLLLRLPRLVCITHKFHNNSRSKGRPRSCKHHQKHPTKISPFCEPSKDDCKTQEDNHQNNNNNKHNHLYPNNKKGDSQANNNREDED